LFCLNIAYFRFLVRFGCAVSVPHFACSLTLTQNGNSLRLTYQPFFRKKTRKMGLGHKKLPPQFRDERYSRCHPNYYTYLTYIPLILLNKMYVPITMSNHLEKLTPSTSKLLLLDTPERIQQLLYRLAPPDGSLEKFAVYCFPSLLYLDNIITF
jgi:hypothetical protein